MIDFPTTPTGGVRSVRKPAHKQHPHHTRQGGVGVWCGGETAKSQAWKTLVWVGRCLGQSDLEFQAGCRLLDRLGRGVGPERL
jgi:hypothetical protein